MRLEQHIYTNDKIPGLPSAANTDGISSFDIRKLEQYSLYFLPPTLLFRRETAGPTKYIYYSLDDQRSVVGRANYIGRDSLGRPGKYFFHNFVVQKEDLLTLALNPLPLINWLENQGLFLEKFPQEPLRAIEIPELKSVPIESNPLISHDDWVKILHFCHNYYSLGKPLLVIGSESQCRDFLTVLFYSLPLELRTKISFDSYSYGTELDHKIICVPDETQFQRPIQYILKLNLTSQQLSSNITLKEPTKADEFVAQMVSSGRLGDINAMYKVEYLLQKEDYGSFKEGLKNLPLNIRDFLIESNLSRIVSHLKSENDLDLLPIVVNQLESRDIETLAANFDMIRGLTETQNERILSLFVMWFYKHKTRTEFYPLLFSNPVVLKMFFKWIETCYYDLTFLAESFKLLPAYYSAESEYIFLEKILSVVRYLKTDEKLGPEFCQILKLLPTPQSEKIGWLRAWTQYQLCGKEDLLNLLAIDINHIPEPYRDSFKEALLKSQNRIA